MISQFVSAHEQRLLCDLDYKFPAGTNAVGRLDDDSEGLLILTTDKTLTKRLLHPNKKHRRKYIVQVERVITEETIEKLTGGIDILIKRKGIYHTQPCEVKVIEKPQDLPDRAHAFREYIPHSWLEITLTEGKNRQIRKMCSAVRHDCKRLIRTHIEDLGIEGMVPGEVREIEREDLFKLLRLDHMVYT